MSQSGISNKNAYIDKSQSSVFSHNQKKYLRNFQKLIHNPDVQSQIESYLPSSISKQRRAMIHRHVFEIKSFMLKQQKYTAKMEKSIQKTNLPASPQAANSVSKIFDMYKASA